MRPTGTGHRTMLRICPNDYYEYFTKAVRNKQQINPGRTGEKRRRVAFGRTRLCAFRFQFPSFVRSPHNSVRDGSPAHIITTEIRDDPGGSR